MNPRLADLSDDDRQVLESWLVEFDQGWDEGLLANRLGQIPPGSSWRLPALAEMVKIDLQQQWRTRPPGQPRVLPRSSSPSWAAPATSPPT